MIRPLRMSRQLCSSIVAACSVATLAVPASAEIARALLRERDPLPGAPAGQIVSALSNTAVNHVGGYAVSVNSSDGVSTLSHVWGNANAGPGTVLRTEGTFGSLVQTAFESFYGMSDAGQIAYSATGTGGPVGNFDSVWLDGTPLAVQGNPVPSLPGQFYVFASRPGVTANGHAYWSSGYSNTAAGSSQNRVLLFGAGATVKLQGGVAVPGLPAPPVTGSISFDYRFSELGNHFIIPVVMSTGSTLHDDAMVMDGSGLLVGGVLVREQTPVPVVAGGLPGENWDNFDFCGVTEAGDWFFTGDTEPSTTNDEIIVVNGVVTYREGNVVDGETLSGDIEGAYMNADGDVAYIWDVQANTREALFVNNQLVLRETDLVDLTGDGVVDAGKRLVDFTGISALTMSDRDNLGNVKIYFTADVDTAGTASTTDDIEAFFCLEANVGVPVAVTLQSFTAATGPNGEVTLAWTTSHEVEHRGFHVYRSANATGPFERLTSALVTGRSPYAFVDAAAETGRPAFYRLGAVDRNGRETQLGLVSALAQIGRNALLPNYPNPFAGSTDLRFTLDQPGSARLLVFDPSGRLVRTWNVAGGRGMHAIRWDGRDGKGRTVANGSYFVRLETAGRTQSRKIVRIAGE